MTKLYLSTLAIAAGSVSLQPSDAMSEQVNELREVLSAAVTTPSDPREANGPRCDLTAAFQRSAPEHLFVWDARALKMGFPPSPRRPLAGGTA